MLNYEHTIVNDVSKKYNIFILRNDINRLYNELFYLHDSVWQTIKWFYFNKIDKRKEKLYETSDSNDIENYKIEYSSVEFERMFEDFDHFNKKIFEMEIELKNLSLLEENNK